MSQNYLRIIQRSKYEDSLLELLPKYEKIFDGTLDEYTSSDYITKLKEDAKSHHAKPSLIPTMH